MTVRRCQCGGPMAEKSGIAWCRHCDEPHRGPVIDCGACRRVTRAEGLGPSLEDDEVS